VALVDFWATRLIESRFDTDEVVPGRETEEVSPLAEEHGRTMRPVVRVQEVYVNKQKPTVLVSCTRTWCRLRGERDWGIQSHVNTRLRKNG
jgi:hypothetical protein